MPTSGVERVYSTRHGRTALNADGRLRGEDDKGQGRPRMARYRY